MATNEEILMPKAFIVPTHDLLGFKGQEAAGTLVMSGASLYVAVSAGTFEEVTSS